MKMNHTHRKILLYASLPEVEAGLKPVPTEEGLTRVNSPISCLHEATQEPFDLIAVSFYERPLKERNALVELCRMLKTNSCTAHIPLLGLMPSVHRRLLEHLLEAGADYAMLSDPRDRGIDDILKGFLVSPSEEFRIENVLYRLCPHINPVPISRRREILYCRAYRNRLVLGPYLLGLYCETLNHRDCPYYKCPKFREDVYQEYRGPILKDER